MTAVIYWIRRILVAWRDWLTPQHALPKPVMQYTDPSGQQWAFPPDYMDATAIDNGQNDVWKREMRFAFWRFQNGFIASGMFSLRDMGLSIHDADLKSKDALFPVSTDLACACRRLGFQRLVRATGLLTDPDVSEYQLGQFWKANEIAARNLADAVYACNLETAQSLHHEFATVDQTFALFTLGPINGHVDQPPMRPFVPVGSPPVASVTGR